MNSETPPKPIATDSVAWTAFDDVPRFNIRYKHLTIAACGPNYRIGVAIEELPPGMQTAPAHYHFLEEEHLFILEGSLTLRLGAERHRMQAGDYACFPAGQKAGQHESGCSDDSRDAGSHEFLRIVTSYEVGHGL